MARSRQTRSRFPSRSRYVNPGTIGMTVLLLPSVALAKDSTSSTAQLTTPFTEQATGLQMERFFGARTGFGFAIALPQQQQRQRRQQASQTGSFIGQMTFPLKNGIGWGAMGLTGEMEGNFILAAWPDGKGGVMASFRQAIDEDNPAEVKGNFAVRPIADGVSVNNTFLTYTFLCENCLDATLGLGPAATAGNRPMGWALSEKAPKGSAADPGARLGFHERGFGPFTARLGNAATAVFDAVAAKAGAPVGASQKAIAPKANIFDGDGSGDEGGGSDSDSDSDDDD
ncbi:uncharacterized protein E0L32_008926 [Thyridium curvatum]|uniref:Cellobiose dehydrogenase-like cytochrome domain-containing protein n=1 Tax=Thyridium curvatum TaxID=1093900 RepID=A0A507ATS9_9PEZI|nr:uncharacterized protein E0L32_008926 [Thyridium curvatum]TPX09904.1 hypothetical protein E0L32_008926 [Thyridium curvatum]